MADTNELIENIAMQIGSMIDSLTRRYICRDPRATEAIIHRAVCEKVSALLSTVRPIRDSFVVIGTITGGEVSNLHLDINAFEVEYSLDDAVKIEVSMHGGSVILIVTPKASEAFRESLQKGSLHQNGWGKKLITFP